MAEGLGTYEGGICSMIAYHNIRSAVLIVMFYNIT